MQRRRGRRVFCLGLTPAVQRTLVLDGLATGEVNRVREVRVSAGGKAVNAARVLAALKVPALTLGFNGGASGRIVAGCLEREGVADALTPMRAPTRTCTTLIDRSTGAVTELVEEAPDPGRAALRRLRRDVAARLRDASMLLICGTLPPFAGADMYAFFAAGARKSGVPVIVDSQKDALMGALAHAPLVAKLNVVELEATLGLSMARAGSMLDGMRRLADAGAQNVLVTHGGGPAHLLTRAGECWRFTPPALRKVVNPVGSGDCATAGLACALLRGKALPDAVAFGLACGSANAETLLPADVAPARIHALVAKVSIARMA